MITSSSMRRLGVARACRRITSTPLPMLAALLAGALALCGCAGNASSSSPTTRSSGASHSETIATTASSSIASVKLHLDEGSRSVESATAIVRGTVTRGAKVTVNGQLAHVRATKWQRVVHLHLGRNRVRLRATLAGAHGARRGIVIVRERSVAEIERRRQLHEAAVQRRTAEEAEAQEAKEAAQAAEEAKAAEEASSPSGECTNGTYVNSAGNVVCRPEEAASPPAGATAECEDGTYSFSESRSGTCSSHGGVKRWL